jgi:hypothetical protein
MLKENAIEGMIRKMLRPNFALSLAFALWVLLCGELLYRTLQPGAGTVAQHGINRRVYAQ